LAEWIQEDPTKVVGAGGPEPYPALSDARFSRLRVDGREPNLSIHDALWMSERGQTLAPSPLHGGAFTVQSVQFGRPQEQYLSAIVPINRATSLLENEEQEWGAEVSVTLAKAQALHYANVVKRFDRTVAGEGWPPTVLAPLGTFRRALDKTVDNAERMAASASASRDLQLQQASYAEELLSNTFALRVRAALGLPAP
jgi:hypothetical protein